MMEKSSMSQIIGGLLGHSKEFAVPGPQAPWCVSASEQLKRRDGLREPRAQGQLTESAPPAPIPP